MKGRSLQCKNNYYSYHQNVKMLREASLLHWTKLVKTCCIFHEEDGDENMNMYQCILPFQAIILATTCMARHLFMFLRPKTVGLLHLKNYHQKKSI